jgi:hypothetical protein
VPVLAIKQKSAVDTESVADNESVADTESAVVTGLVSDNESVADNETDAVKDTTQVAQQDTTQVAQDTSSVAKSNSVKEDDWTRKLHVKTNAIGLGLGIANVAPEIDIAKHLSFTLPVYYSAWNYFKTTIKFRTLAVQPELRYWISPNNEGFFAGAHFGLAYYNFAADGDYRYQDHNGKKPAIGGGLSIGYVLPISDNNRWRIEFSLGAGVYAVHYDKFFNTPNTKEGLMIDSGKTTYWGIDQAAISFVYTFNLKKKGDRR